MPHHLSTVRRLAGVRQIFTGESTSSLRPWVRDNTSYLTVDDRATITTFLDHGVNHAIANPSAELPLPDRVRHAVLADTRNPAQQRLEAGLLRALGRTVLHLPPELPWQGPVCASVRPAGPADLGLHLRPSIIAPMLAELVVPGLRVIVGRRHVRLLLDGEQATASVSLAAVSERQWAAAIRYAHLMTGTLWPADHGRSEPVYARLAPDGEKSAHTTPLCGALLRRLGVFGSTSWLVVDIDDHRLTIHVTWSGGVAAATAAAHLTHPLAGLPARRFETHHNADDVTLMVHDPEDEPAVAIVLRNLDADSPPPRARTDTAAAWVAFDAGLTRPASPAKRPPR